MAWAEDAWAAAWAGDGRLRRARPAEMADREAAVGTSDRRVRGGLLLRLRLVRRLLASLGLAWTERSSSCSRSRSQASSEVSFGMGGLPMEEEEEEERLHALALFSSMSMSRVPVYGRVVLEREVRVSENNN